MTIRVATAADAPALLAIYAPYVIDTAITFEYDVPSVEEFARRIESTLQKYPYIVAEEDGVPLGYAYAGVFHAREAYDWAVETSIYVTRDSRGRGIGRALYNELERLLKMQGIINCNACIGYPNGEADEHLDYASRRFHERMGYDFVGEFHRCGSKFGRWYNMIWMEKMLGEHPENPVPVIPFRELQKSGCI